MDEINSKIVAKENLIGSLVGSGSAVEIEVRVLIRLYPSILVLLVSRKPFRRACVACVSDYGFLD
jgi:hypothetical protein